MSQSGQPFFAKMKDDSNKLVGKKRDDSDKEGEEDTVRDKQLNADPARGDAYVPKRKRRGLLSSEDDE